MDDLDHDPLLAGLPVRDGRKLLEPCLLLGRIGRGGMGTVYLARHLNLQIDVAIKCLDVRDSGRTDPEAVLRFQREARIAGAINHENLVRIYDVRESHGLHYLIMELVQGLTVQDLVARQGALPPARAAALMLQAARGVGAAHEAGVVHRDVKPANLLVRADGRVKVADLGLAKATGAADPDITGRNRMMGTPRYMPPEQFEDAGQVGPASDVYSLGATLYYILTGQHGIGGDSVSEIMRRVCVDGFPDIRSIRPDLPGDLGCILRRSTRLRPEDRFANANALAQALLGTLKILGEPLPVSVTDVPAVSLPPAEVQAETARFWMTFESTPARTPTPSPTPGGDWRLAHPLQPAPHFSGREELISEIVGWLGNPDHPDRVLALVGMGGAGKTAVTEQVIRRWRARAAARTMVWSFYENPNTDAFLREACVFFAGSEGEGAGGRLERLQRALADGPPHLLVVDGLEVMQSDGQFRRARGELHDNQLKNLLRSVAGGLGRSRALVTSRYRLRDLQSWEGAGARTIALDSLDPESCRQLLRAWGVEGSDRQLDRLSEGVGHHALSVAALGSFIRNFGNGDPATVAEFDVGDVAADDPQAARLGRVLSGYASALPVKERELLSVISAFPRGVDREQVSFALRGCDRLAPALDGAEDREIRQLESRLAERGLVFTYPRGGRTFFNAHPFLRKHFRDLLGSELPSLHGRLRERLLSSLDGAPQRSPEEAPLLDQLEELVELSVLAGRHEDAWDLYATRLGGYKHLGWVLGDYTRVLRVLSHFTADGELSAPGRSLSSGIQDRVLKDFGLAAQKIGELDQARRYFETLLPRARQRDDLELLRSVLCYLSSTEASRGEFVRARSLAAEAVAIPAGRSAPDAFGDLARACHALGELEESERLFAEATRLEEEPLFSMPGLYEIEHLAQCGRTQEAVARAAENLERCTGLGWGDQAALCHAQLGLLHVTEDVVAAGRHLAAVRERTSFSGNIECILQGHRLAAEMARARGDPQGAVAEAAAGLNLAEGSGYERYVMELLLIQARAALEMGQPAVAIARAERVVRSASRPSSGYLWGEADGLHELGRAYAALQDRTQAGSCLRRALELRARLKHPGSEPTRRELQQLEG